MLQRFQAAGLTIKLEKCKFGKTSIDLLGQKIDREGIKPIVGRLDAIELLSRPYDIAELRRFLGLTSYYRRFIVDYAKKSGPSADLLKKEVKWKWGPDENAAFERLKHDLINSRGVAHFSPTAKLEIKTDASRQGIGAISIQEENGEKSIVTCASRRLTPAETKYPVTELEAAAIVFAVGRFRPYIYGTQVTVWTDHCALCAINKKRNLPRRLAHWALILQEFDLNIRYVSG